MKVNFKRMKFWSGIDHTQTIEQDVSLDLANLIYKFGDIRGMDLALRIYKSDGELELTDLEYGYLKDFVSSHCSPQMIEALQIIND